MPSADIGLAQLAMHSSYETAGVKDVSYMVDALTMFYNTGAVEGGTDYDCAASVTTHTLTSIEDYRALIAK